jgi:hypothetical protein
VELEQAKSLSAMHLCTIDEVIGQGEKRRWDSNLRLRCYKLDSDYTRSGAVVGDGADVWSFKGIPYAAPPVGELRWKPPATPIPWEGERKTTSFGADCMQKPGSPTRAPGFSEDCLTVNIWTKAGSAEGSLPVMMFVYGGGFIKGSGSILFTMAKPSLAEASCWLRSITEQASLDS